jgi:hypothetical protein
LTLKSNCCKIAIENVAVLPVPDCAWAITSRPFKVKNNILNLKLQHTSNRIIILSFQNNSKLIKL